MFKNYVLIAVRNLKRHKTYSLINILGLAIGMVCFILIALYILTEFSYDKYHENANRIFRLEADLTLGGDPIPVATTNFPPTFAMRNDYREVINSVRILPQRKVLIEYENKRFYEERIYYAEETVFDIFTFPMVKGDPKTALETARSIVITERMAEKYFGAEDPIGKTLKLNNRTECSVTGVIRNVPANSHFVFDMLLSFQTFAERNKETVESWMSYFGCFGYILLHENSDYKELEKKLPAMKEKYIGNALDGTGVNVEYFLTPLTAIHLHSHKRHEIAGNSDIMYVYIFGAVAVFILLMACINFMNLATARSVTRAREIGMRKVLGANRSQIAKQFFGESIFYSVLSLAIAITLVQLALPVFSSLSDRELSISHSRIPWLIPALAGLALLVGLVSGSYPAILLSGFHPVKVLKGNWNVSASSAGFRKILVVVQFAISISLIIGTLMIIAQLNYMKNTDLGFDMEQVVVIPIMDRALVKSLESIKEETGNYNDVISVTASSHVPGGITSGASFVPEGYPEGQAQMMNRQFIDDDYISTMGMEIAEGRNFSREFPADTAESILINETAVRTIGWDDPIGKTIYYSGDPDKAKKRVVGVVKDFHYMSLHMEIEPLYIGREMDLFRFVFVRINQRNIPATLAFLESKWKEFDPGRPFEYYFLDESYDLQYRPEEKLRSIFFNFTLLAIFIACLGLFGLASFAAEQRTKEIGIRKVLGASVSGIVLLLSKEFTKWVLIANLIAWPVVWLASKKWFENFAYHTEIKWHLFIVSGVLAMCIALVTVMSQAIKTAQASPVNAIKYE
jgi:putative ABC transport system permease protein